MKLFAVLVSFGLVKTFCAQSFCTTPNGEEAKCIPIKECQIFLDVLKGGIRPPPSVADFMRESNCGFDNGPLVCCGSFNHSKELTPSTADPRKHKNFHLLPKNCGLQDHDEKILRLNEAQLDEFPWMALVDFQPPDKPENEFLCGGTLINSQYVVTAAHCFDRDRPFTVRLGEHDLKTEIDCRRKYQGSQNYELCVIGHQDIAIDRIIRHPGYDNKLKNNDIALIRLARPATITTSVIPICLPVDGKESPPGKKMFVAGWGRTSFVGDLSNVKLKAQLPIVGLEKCKEKYSNTRVKLTEKHLCAGGERNVDTCSGDSGNSLVTFKEGSVPTQWYMEGIVSFGRACGLTDSPTVFTRVSSYLNWILDHIE